MTGLKERCPKMIKETNLLRGLSEAPAGGQNASNLAHLGSKMPIWLQCIPNMGKTWVPKRSQNRRKINKKLSQEKTLTAVQGINELLFQLILDVYMYYLLRCCAAAPPRGRAAGLLRRRAAVCPRT